MKESKLVRFIGLLFVVSNIWIGISCAIQSFSCPKMTQTEIFLNIPNSFIANFECSK